MRYFILFFYLLFGQIATIQANYSTLQTVNYQVITADIANPIEPIQQKNKNRIKTTTFSDFLYAFGIFLLIVFLIALFAAFPFGLFYNIFWLWLTGAIFQGVLLFLCSLLFADSVTGTKEAMKNSSPDDYARNVLTSGMAAAYAALLFFSIIALNAIILLAFGIIFNILWLWITCIAYLLVFVILYFIFW